MSDTDKMTALVQLSGVVAHELNNIFTAVIGNLSLLDDQLEHGSEPALVIGEVVRTAQRGIALSAKLQTFAGRQPLKRKHIDINRSVVDFVNGIRAHLPRGIEIVLIPMSYPGVSFVDDDKLRDTIDELVKNAVTAMNGTGKVFIDIRTRKFLTEDSSDLKPGAYIGIRTNVNSGWGLSNCFGFVRQSGGTMTIDSRPGHGTSVEIFLPVSLEGAIAG